MTTKFYDGEEFDLRNLMRRNCGVAPITLEEFAQEKDLAAEQAAKQYRRDLKILMARHSEPAAEPSAGAGPWAEPAAVRPAKPLPPPRQSAAEDIIDAIRKDGVTPLERGLQDALVEQLRVESIPVTTKSAMGQTRATLIAAMRAAIVRGSKGSKEAWARAISGILEAWAAKVPGGEDLRLDEEVEEIVQLGLMAEQWAADGNTAKGIDPTIAASMRRAAGVIQ